MIGRARPALAALLAALGVGCALCPCARAAREPESPAPCLATGSPLALVSVAPARPPLAPVARSGEAATPAAPELLLAQRAIEREWVAPGDSAALAGRIPGAKSEIKAALLSAVLPGAGELYVGERSGFAFLAAEVASVVGLVLLRRGAEDLREDAERLAGTPTDSTSAWSFERWAEATGGDPSELEAIYTHDPEAFWDRLARDPELGAGWASAAEAADYSNLRSRASLRQRRSNQLGSFVWVNHLVSVADALRAARLHNLPLGGNLELRARGGIKRGEPSLMLTLARRF